MYAVNLALVPEKTALVGKNSSITARIVATDSGFDLSEALPIAVRC
jgi:hypothetical protein